jgi:hypothetical protein
MQIEAVWSCLFKKYFKVRIYFQLKLFIIFAFLVEFDVADYDVIVGKRESPFVLGQIENFQNSHVISSIFSQKANYYFTFYQAIQCVFFSEKFINLIKLNENIKSRWADKSRYNVINIKRKNFMVLQCFARVKFDEFQLNEDFVYLMKGKILHKNSILQEGDNFVWYYKRLLGGRLEFEQVHFPLFVVFTD